MPLSHHCTVQHWKATIRRVRGVFRWRSHLPPRGSPATLLPPSRSGDTAGRDMVRCIHRPNANLPNKSSYTLLSCFKKKRVKPTNEFNTKGESKRFRSHHALSPFSLCDSWRVVVIPHGAPQYHRLPILSFLTSAVPLRLRICSLKTTASCLISENTLEMLAAQGQNSLPGRQIQHAT